MSFRSSSVLYSFSWGKAGQSGGLSLSNIGINFGGTATQTTKVGNVTPEWTKSGKADWVGLGIAAIGLVTAAIGLLKGNSASLWPSISVAWAALLLAVVLLGSLFFVISNWLAKIAGAVSFAYRLRRLAWLASRWQLRFRPIGVGGS
jgi:hypothetical protein